MRSHPIRLVVVKTMFFLSSAIANVVLEKYRHCIKCTAQSGMAG